jgi:4-amino-4-deoxy-L-arabinose transferase-like glycosyltransferase
VEEPGGLLASSRRRSGLDARFWRSPPQQPPWARPALLAIAAAAALAYAWGIDEAALQPFYGAAARSMSQSWHDFLFGSFDPLGTVSVDKLPGALWPQALSLRAFGFHTWAIVLPQALEGVLTVLVLYRATRRLAGPIAGIAAAAILAASPVTVALNRGNVSDSLLVMLTVLAADATVAALCSGRLRSLLLAGVWVGLAFQAKMLQAWLVLPALAIAYLVCAPAPLRVRARQVALAGLTTVAVSLSWMTAVTLVPASARPYVDASQNDSLFSQVFEYNGFARLGRSKSLAGAGHRTEALTRITESKEADEQVPPSWHRLLDGLYGRDIGWLAPAAAIAAAGILIARRRAGRRDPRRAAVLLWGTWLLVLWAFFSDGVYLHSYYVAALAPAIAALCGSGLAEAWSRRERPSARRTLAGATIASVAYGVYLLGGGVGVPSWLVPAAACAGTGAATAVLLARRRALPSRAIGVRATLAAVGACLLIPAVASALIVTRSLGPFAAPFESPSASESTAQARAADAANAQLAAEMSATYRTPIVFAIDSSRLAAPFILATGEEILPIGGYEGGVPAPTVAQLRRYISSGMLRAVLLPTGGADPRFAWVYRHCTRTPWHTSGALVFYRYDCGSS